MTDDIVKRLRERTTLRYMADCKCGKCQLVHIDDVNAAADRIAALEAALHQISLGSQNSMTSKEDFGATARRALKK